MAYTKKDTKKEIKKSELLGEEYIIIRHKSGLNICVFYKDLSTTYALLGTRYGSFDNRFRVKGEQEFAEVPEGIAHFLEHKMFEMEDGRDAFELYAEAGADANAYTSVDGTAYLFTCTERFEENLRILMKMVTEPHFNAESVEKEQGIIGEEIKMGEDRVGHVIYYGLMNAMYHNSPIKIPVAGTVESIAKITPELLYRCYNTFYVPSNMSLCVCGRVDADEILRVVDEYFTETDGTEIECSIPEEPEEIVESRATAYMQVSRPTFSIGVKDTTPMSEDICRYNMARYMINEALFSNSSELYSELYESGLVGGYGSGWNIERGYSYLNVRGDADEPEEVFKKFVEYTKRCVENGISEEQFIRARRVMYARAVRVFDSTSDIAEELFSDFLDGADFFKMVEIVYQLEKSELEELVRQIFKPERYVMSVVLPKNDGEACDGAEDDEDEDSEEE